jgi:hypothetical protein
MSTKSTKPGRIPHTSYEQRPDLAKSKRGKMSSTKRDAKIDFPLRSNKITFEIQMSPSSLPHLIIGTSNFRPWLTNPRLKAEIEILKKWQGASSPLAPIYRLI